MYFWEPANGLIISGTQLPIDGCFGNHLAQRDGYIALVAVRTIGSLENIFGKFGHFLVHSASAVSLHSLLDAIGITRLGLTVSGLFLTGVVLKAVPKVVPYRAHDPVFITFLELIGS